MIDTSVCIRALRARSPSLRERFEAEADQIAISSVVFMELLHGARVSARPRQHRMEVEDFVDRLRVLDLDQAAADHAADIKADLRLKGTPIGVHDTLIAGHARSRGMVLVTGNLKEFRRVDGLRCIDWPEDAP
ncbi:type II toxin-antitoxin system VapC family toxin [Brevundimonas balnearis]|uniref:Ribonuclease VapC n=1 Tax=Brevundimonas balnearis TaxID=1572858 RepID=A0ABV6R2P6_9CAUL